VIFLKKNVCAGKSDCPIAGIRKKIINRLNTQAI
jgi:hypothetical protein